MLTSRERRKREAERHNREYEERKEWEKARAETRAAGIDVRSKPGKLALALAGIAASLSLSN